MLLEQNFGLSRVFQPIPKLPKIRITNTLQNFVYAISGKLSNSPFYLTQSLYNKFNSSLVNHRNINNITRTNKTRLI